MRAHGSAPRILARQPPTATTGKLGDSMFGTKTDVPMNEVKKLYDEAAHRSRRNEGASLVPVSARAPPQGHQRGARCGRRFGRHAGRAGAEPPTTPEIVRKSLQKDRRHAVYIENMRIEVQDGLMIGVRDERHAPRCLDLLLAKRRCALRDWLHGSVLPRDDRPLPARLPRLHRSRAHQGAGGCAARAI